MPLVEIPQPWNPSKDELLTRLDEKGRVVRYENLVEEDSLPARRTLDELVLEGTIARFPVGEYILIRDLRDGPERVKGWPHEDHINDVDERGLIP